MRASGGSLCSMTTPRTVLLSSASLPDSPKFGSTSTASFWGSSGGSACSRLCWFQSRSAMAMSSVSYNVQSNHCWAGIFGTHCSAEHSSSKSKRWYAAWKSSHHSARDSRHVRFGSSDIPKFTWHLPVDTVLDRHKDCIEQNASCSAEDRLSAIKYQIEELLTG